MVCSLALEQPVLEMSLISACSGPSTRQNWTSFLSSLDPVAPNLAHLQTLSHVSNHYSLNFMILFGAWLFASPIKEAGIEVWRLGFNFLFPQSL